MGFRRSAGAGAGAGAAAGAAVGGIAAATLAIATAVVAAVVVATTLGRQQHQLHLRLQPQLRLLRTRTLVHTKRRPRMYIWGRFCLNCSLPNLAITLYLRRKF